MPPSRPSQGGFTLLELLVAITLLALLSLVLFGSLKLGSQIWLRSAQTTAETNHSESARQLLIQALSRAYPAIDTSDGATGDIDFDGTPDHLRFLAPSPSGSAGLSHIALRRTIDSAGHMTLDAEAAPELAANAAPTPLFVLSGLSAATFSYFGPPIPGAPARWQPNWRGRRHLPLLVRLHIVAVAGSGRFLPDLIVAPRITAAEGCTLNLIRHDCEGRP